MVGITGEGHGKFNADMVEILVPRFGDLIENRVTGLDPAPRPGDVRYTLRRS
jgi:hypothetical protein